MIFNERRQKDSIKLFEISDVYSYGKDGSRWKTRNSDGFGAPESRHITYFTNEAGIDQYVITQDIPFLFWCLKNDVNVIAKKAKGTKCTLCWKICENACERDHCPKNT